MTSDAAAIAPSPTLEMDLPPPAAATATTSKKHAETHQVKPIVHLDSETITKLEFSIHRHTPSSPVPTHTLRTFVELINASFSGPVHEANFGAKLRYASTDLLLQDLNHSDEGGWIFLLCTPGGKAVAGAKVTLSGQGMDGGVGTLTLLNPHYQSPRSASSLPTFWLGALGSIAPGAGALLISHIKSFLSTSTPSFVLKAFTVSQWGQGDQTIPRDSPLVAWFQRQGFAVLDYSWKPPGTWGSYYGACLCAIEYVHASAERP